MSGHLRDPKEIDTDPMRFDVEIDQVKFTVCKLVSLAISSGPINWNGVEWIGCVPHECSTFRFVFAEWKWIACAFDRLPVIDYRTLISHSKWSGPRAHVCGCRQSRYAQCTFRDIPAFGTRHQTPVIFSLAGLLSAHHCASDAYNMLPFHQMKRGKNEAKIRNRAARKAPCEFK